MGKLNAAIPEAKKSGFDAHEKREKDGYRLIKEKKVAEAVVLFEENLEWSRKELGNNHAATVWDKETLAFYLNELKDYKRASDLDGQALDTRTKIEGLTPPSTEFLETQLNLANDFLGLKDLKKACQLYQKNYELRKSAVSAGDDNPDTLRVGYDLAACWHKLRDLKKAKDLNSEILAGRIRQKGSGCSEQQIWSSREALALCNLDLGELGTAEALYRENIEELKSKKGKNAQPETLLANERALKVCRSRKELQKSKDVPKLATIDMEKMQKLVAVMKRDQLNGIPEAVSAKKEIYVKSNRRANPQTQEAGTRVEKNQVDEKSTSKNTQAVTVLENTRHETGPSGSRPMDHKDSIEDPRKDLASKEIAPKSLSGGKQTINEPKPKPIHEANPSKECKTSSDSTTPSAPVSIPRINVPSDQPPKSTTLSKRRSLDLGSKIDNEMPRRSKSQQGRPERKFDFRHIASSEALSQLGPKSDKADQDASFDPLPGSMPGSWIINPADLHHSSISPRTNNPTLQLPGPSSPAKPPSGILRTPSPTRSVSDSKRSGQLLFDAEEGKYDEHVVRPVDNWFQLLGTETQSLLEQKRRSICRRVSIAILDTGVDLKHPEFAEDQAKPNASNRRIKKPMDFVDPKGNGMDVCGHGTHCVGMLRKVAPWANIHIARVVTDFNGDLDPMIVAKAIRKAGMDGNDPDGKKNWNVDIITMSFGFYGSSTAIQDAIHDVRANKTLIFAAASNNGTRKDMTFPAWLEGVICVNSANADGIPSDFNPEIEGSNNFSILGENVRSAWITGEDREPYRRMSGTSVATPIAAGIAALVLEYALQNDPESFIKDLEALKSYDGMTKVFDAMKRVKYDYRNIVPWQVLSVEESRIMAAALIEKALRRFRTH